MIRRFVTPAREPGRIVLPPLPPSYNIITPAKLYPPTGRKAIGCGFNWIRKAESVRRRSPCPQHREQTLPLRWSWLCQPIFQNLFQVLLAVQNSDHLQRHGFWAVDDNV